MLNYKEVLIIILKFLPYALQYLIDYAIKMRLSLIQTKWTTIP